MIDFPHRFINRQSFHFVFENGSFGREIASARTFGFTTEIEALRKANLALGGSLDNAIVLTPDGMLNENPLRFSDEFVRHKILNIIGDMALLGMPVVDGVAGLLECHAALFVYGQASPGWVSGPVGIFRVSTSGSSRRLSWRRAWVEWRP